MATVAPELTAEQTAAIEARLKEENPNPYPYP